jgi:hypothetical protein
MPSSSAPRPSMAEATLSIEVVWIGVEPPVRLALRVPTGTTVEQALAAGVAAATLYSDFTSQASSPSRTSGCTAGAPKAPPGASTAPGPSSSKTIKQKYTHRSISNVSSSTGGVISIRGRSFEARDGSPRVFGSRVP